MESYILALTAEVGEALNITAWSITGHSMGGLGALHLGLRHDRFVSVSAFSPICHPSVCPWGIKAFTAYLGDENKDAWATYDPTALVRAGRGGHIRGPILIDQGSADNFLSAGQLHPRDLVSASSAPAAVVTVEYREQPGYDHSYYFIASFMRDHVRHHVGHLRAFVADAAAAKRHRPA
jgi:S-formylglutathione hydrolase